MLNGIPFKDAHRAANEAELEGRRNPDKLLVLLSDAAHKNSRGWDEHNLVTGSAKGDVG
jgi:hypothetical protein